MTIIYFIIILAVLVLVHELGHFLVAKAVKMRVDEFGIGFPPRIARLLKKGDTEYTLNLLPIGGFVRIYGEDYDDASKDQEQTEPQQEAPKDDDGTFTKKPRSQQALVLVAGVTFNMIFAWLLISAGYMIGLPTSITYDGVGTVTDPKTVVVSVIEGSPAEKAGLKVGDTITGLEADGQELAGVTPDAITSFITQHSEAELTVQTSRGEETSSATIKPASFSSLVPDMPSEEGRKIIGIQMDEIGTLQLLPHQALRQGFLATGEVTVAIAVGLSNFIYQAVTGVADYSQVAGPVGIVGLVGDASTLGFIYLLQFTAFISINLALINLIPFPALDGGRLVFVGIEALKGSPINPAIANTLNTVGFVLLILLMVLVTYNDVIRLF